MLELYKYILDLFYLILPTINRDLLMTVLILISLGIMFVVGFALSKLTKLIKLPNVTAYIVAGVLVGPILGLIPGSGAVYTPSEGESFAVDIVSKMGFISDIALGFIAFGVGKYFKKNVLVKAGFKVILITLMEALLAGVLVTLVVGLIWPNLGWSFALLLGAIATATAPASTMMTIKQYEAKGDFVDTLLQVVALDDIVCLVVFSIALGISNGMTTGTFDLWHDIFLPLLLNLMFIVIGAVAGLLLGFIYKGRSPNSKLIITVGIICLISGFGALLNVSPLLSCMVFGAVYINVTQKEKIFKYIDHFSPPIMMLFFMRSGMTMQLNAFATVGVIGVVYFAVRIIGKYFGAFFGCKIARKEKKTTIYLGLALIPQAGVALGLAELGRRCLMNASPDIAGTFASIIICSSILYEMAGPILAKLALVKSGAIPSEMLSKPVRDINVMMEHEQTYNRINVSDLETAQSNLEVSENKSSTNIETLEKDESEDQNKINNK